MINTTLYLLFNSVYFLFGSKVHIGYTKKMSPVKQTIDDDSLIDIFNESVS